VSQRRSGNRNSKEEAEAKLERRPVTPKAIYTIKIDVKFRPPQIMSYLSNIERIRKVFYFHDIEESVAREEQKFALYIQGIQRAFEKSLLLASLWAGIALTMALLFLVIIVGVH
jgi:hypothetical protein